MIKQTTIRIDIDLKDYLDSKGNRKETYQGIIKRLIGYKKEIDK